MITDPGREARAAMRALATTMLGGLARVLTVAAEGARLAARQLDLPAREPNREASGTPPVRDAVDGLPDEPVRVSPPLFDDEPWDAPPDAAPKEPWDPVSERLVEDPWSPAAPQVDDPAAADPPRVAPEGPGPVPVDGAEHAAAVEPVKAAPDGPELTSTPTPLTSEVNPAQLGERSAREVIAAVGSLSREELSALEVYERAHKQRKTVLAAIERARAG